MATSAAEVLGLSRQSLYVNFDPLVGGRPSVLGRPSVAPFARKTEPEDLIAINTPVNGPRPNINNMHPSQPSNTRRDANRLFKQQYLLSCQGCGSAFFFVDPDQAFFLNADPDLAAFSMRIPIRSFKNFVKNTKLPDKEFA